MIGYGLDWIGKTWTGLIKHRLIKHGLIKHGFMNKKEVFSQGFKGSEYDKHDLHQKSTSASACNDQKPDHWHGCVTGLISPILKIYGKLMKVR